MTVFRVRLPLLLVGGYTGLATALASQQPLWQTSDTASYRSFAHFGLVRMPVAMLVLSLGDRQVVLVSAAAIGVVTGLAIYELTKLATSPVTKCAVALTVVAVMLSPLMRRVEMFVLPDAIFVAVAIGAWLCLRHQNPNVIASGLGCLVLLPLVKETGVLLAGVFLAVYGLKICRTFRHGLGVLCAAATVLLVILLAVVLPAGRRQAPLPNGSGRVSGFTFERYRSATIVLPSAFGRRPSGLESVRQAADDCGFDLDSYSVSIVTATFGPYECAEFTHALDSYVGPRLVLFYLRHPNATRAAAGDVFASTPDNEYFSSLFHPKYASRWQSDVVERIEQALMLAMVVLAVGRKWSLSATLTVATVAAALVVSALDRSDPHRHLLAFMVIIVLGACDAILVAVQSKPAAHEPDLLSRGVVGQDPVSPVSATVRKSGASTTRGGRWL